MKMNHQQSSTSAHSSGTSKSWTVGLDVPSMKGLSLIELLLVLVILASLSLVALESTVGVVDQSRFDSTIQTLENSQRAIVNGESSTQISGYLPDVGAMPGGLQDLVRIPTGVPAYALRDVDVDDDGNIDFQIGSGWRGPYLNLGVGATNVIDGWGALINTNLGVGFNQLTDTLTMTSYGSDKTIGIGDGQYQQDLSVTLTPGMRQGVLEIAQLEWQDDDVSLINPRIGLFRYFPDATVPAGYAFTETTPIWTGIATPGKQIVTDIDPATQNCGVSHLVMIKWSDSTANEQLDSSEDRIASNSFKYLLRPQSTLLLNADNTPEFQIK